MNNIEIQRDSTELTLLEAKETFDDAKRTLAALIDGCHWTRPRSSRSAGRYMAWICPPPPVEILIRRGLEGRPDLAAFRLGILRAQSEVRLARANRFDDVFLLYQPFSIQQALKPGERPATSWAIGLTVPLPVYNRNQGNIARAAETVVQTEVQLANLERQVILEIQQAEAASEVTLTTIERLEAEIMPAARENLEISLRQSGSDKPDAIAIIEAQPAFGDISRQYLKALIRHRRSMFRLNTAVGCRIFP